MRKTLALILTALLFLSFFISCGPDPKTGIAISFDGNGSTGGEMGILTVPKGEAVELPENKYEGPEGYSFTGWNTQADGSGDSYTDGDTVCFENDTTLYAQWHKEVKKITFDCNGGSGAMFPQWVLYDEASVLRPNRFTMEGAVFVGWNTRYDGRGDAYCDSDTIRLTEDTELYAQWARDVREIKFDANGGSGWMLPQWVLYDTATALRPNRYTMSGYHFIGWNTKADGSGDSYPDGDIVSLKENTTLYAQWGFNGVVEIKYDANGGSGWMLPQWAIKDVETVLMQNRFSKEEHFFTGWNTKADGTGDAYSDADTATFEKDTTLFAQWHKEVEKITFDSNGGGGLMFPQWVEKDEATALKPNEFSWKGHYFTGWNTEEDGSGTEYANEAEITTDKDVVLYAQWIMDVSTMEDKTKWNESDGKYFTLSADVTIDERVEITGNIILILPEGKTLSANKGITLSNGNGLVIEGSGKLVADASNVENSAGIGGGCNESCGTVTISGGTVNATGGPNGAGIGGGENGNGGDVRISGGTVTATGGKGAGGKLPAGIGHGLSSTTDGTLTLGDVAAVVSTDNTNWSSYDGSTRTRYMKTIEAIVLTDKTTSWEDGKCYTLKNADVKIEDRINVTGSVTLILPVGRKLTASNGIHVNGTNSLTIGGSGTLTATKPDTYNAGIGGNMGESCGTITITGGTVKAIAGYAGAGIGGGAEGSGGTILISGGTVTATGDLNGAGIGGGSVGSAGNITITGGTVTATGGNDGTTGGAGIGSGGGYATVAGSVTITGGTITASGGPNAKGIGKGAESSDVPLTIGEGVRVYRTGEESPYATGPQDNVETRYQNMTVSTGE